MQHVITLSCGGKLHICQYFCPGDADYYQQRDRRDANAIFQWLQQTIQPVIDEKRTESEKANER